MKTLKKLFISVPLTLIIFIITILKYDLNCMEEYAEGYGHFLVWSMKGPSSLSYFIDTLAFIVDFLIIFFIIFISLLPFSTKLNKKFKIAIYIIAIIIILLTIPYFLISKIYFERIECDVLYSSLSLSWF